MPRRPPTQKQLEFLEVVHRAREGCPIAQRTLREHDLYIWSHDAVTTYRQFRNRLHMTSMQPAWKIHDYYIRVRRSVYTFDDAKVLWYKHLDGEHFIFCVRYDDSVIDYFIARSCNYRIKIICNITKEMENVISNVRYAM